MKKVIFGIFAHPDDEAFGPSGTLLMEKAAGNEVHLICATAGENGTNPDNLPDLGATRLAEWRSAGQLIGADSMHHLGFIDGTLNNNDYFDLVKKIQAIIEPIITRRDDIDIEFMSMDLNGISGHIDHIVVARVATYVYCTLKAVDSRVKRLRLACIPETYVPESNCHWLYMEAGRNTAEIGETVDAREHIDTVLAIMHCHHSQRQDGESHIARRGDDVAVNHFLVL